LKKPHNAHPAGARKSIRVCALEEIPGEPVAESLAMLPYGLVTLRVELAQTHPSHRFAPQDAHFVKLLKTHRSAGQTTVGYAHN